MFDFRYHALSLAAVLLALAVGVVIGVAIGDSDLVSSAKSGIVHDLKEEVGQAQQHASRLSSELSGEKAFANDLYPIAVHSLLSGRSIGVVFLGGPSNRINGLIRDAVTQAGGNLGTVVAVHEPIDLAGVAHAAEGTRFQALAPAAPESSAGAAAAPVAPEPELLEGFGKIVGKQLVSGGANVDRELISRVRARLLTAFDGQLGKLDGVVLVRNEPSTLTPEQAKTAGEFDTGLIGGIAAVGISGRRRRAEQRRTVADPVVPGQGPRERRRSRHDRRTGGARLRADRLARLLRHEADRRLAAAERRRRHCAAVSKRLRHIRSHR